jgi:hypothetical protein
MSALPLKADIDRRLGTAEKCQSLLSAYPIMPLELASSIGETAMAIFQPACRF